MMVRAEPTVRARIFMAIVLGLVAVAAWGVAGYRLTQGVSPLAQPVNSALLTSNRSSLSICLDSKIAEISNETLRLLVDLTLQRVKQHPHFAAAGLSSGMPRVSVGCPGPARILMPGFDWESGYATGQPLAVTQPSEYRTFVFLVPRKQATHRGGYVFHNAAQEMLCDHSGCSEVTSALYLTPEDIATPDSAVPLLTKSVGLDVDPTTPGPD